MRVVHEDQQRPVLGRRAQQAQEPHAHGQRVVERPRRLPHRQRGLDRGGLAVGQLAQVIQQRPGDLAQRRERQLGLGLDTDRLDDLDPGVTGDLAGAGQQRGLADPRLPGDQEGAPAARTGIAQQLADLLDLATASEEHEATLTRTRPISLIPSSYRTRYLARPHFGSRRRAAVPIYITS